MKRKTLVTLVFVVLATGQAEADWLDFFSPRSCAKGTPLSDPWKASDAISAAFNWVGNNAQDYISGGGIGGGIGFGTSGSGNSGSSSGSSTGNPWGNLSGD